MHRREFITSWIRYLLLLFLGGVSLAAVIRSRNAVQKDCLAGSLCQSCGKAKACNLPQKG